MASQTDWEAIEREYRAGQLSTREIGRQHGVSHTIVNKRAKAEGWTRDLAKKVRQEVSSRLVSTEVATGNAREAVEAAAARGVEVVRQHRTSLGRAHRIAEKLMAELERGTDDAEDIEETIEAETAKDANSNRRNAMLKAVSLPTRAGTLRELSQALKNLIPMERQAFNLDANEDDDDRGHDGTTAFAILSKALDLAADRKSGGASGQGGMDQPGASSADHAAGH